LQNLVNVYGAGRSWGTAQCRRSLYRAGVGRPRGKYRPLLVEGQIWIIDDLLGMLERLCRVQQLVEVKVE
jgi:hypothetical protein